VPPLRTHAFFARSLSSNMAGEPESSAGTGAAANQAARPVSPVVAADLAATTPAPAADLPGLATTPPATATAARAEAMNRYWRNTGATGEAVVDSAGELTATVNLDGDVYDLGQLRAGVVANPTLYPALLCDLTVEGTCTGVSLKTGIRCGLRCADGKRTCRFHERQGLPAMLSDYAGRQHAEVCMGCRRARSSAATDVIKHDCGSCPRWAHAGCLVPGPEPFGKDDFGLCAFCYKYRVGPRLVLQIAETTGASSPYHLVVTGVAIDDYDNIPAAAQVPKTPIRVQPAAAADRVVTFDFADVPSMASLTAEPMDFSASAASLPATSDLPGHAPAPPSASQALESLEPGPLITIGAGDR